MAVRPAVDPGLVYLPPLKESAEMQDVQSHSAWQNRIVSRDVVRCFTDSVPRHAIPGATRSKLKHFRKMRLY